MKKTSRICALVLALIMMLGMTSFAAETSEPVPINAVAPTYVALGDSIATGFGVKAEEGYVTMVGAQLGATTKNYAVNGMDTTGLLARLSDSAVKEDIKAAKYITISIGGNNGLIPLTQTMMKALGIEKVEDTAKVTEEIKKMAETDAAGMLKKFSAILDTAKPAITAGVEKFKTEYPKILEAVRALNPNARLLVNTIYNPYKGMKILTMDFDSPAEAAVTSMNETIKSCAQKYAYDTADIYSLFLGEPTYVNAKLKINMTDPAASIFNMDPHPTTIGHKAISEEVLMYFAPKMPWIEASDWALPELSKAYDANIIPAVLSGVSYTENITRAEFAAVALALYETIKGEAAVLPADYKNPFTDTKDEDVLKANALGLVAGKGDGTFAPDGSLTRQEAAMILYNTLKLLAGDKALTLNGDAQKFADDAYIAGWARDAVYYMVQEKYLYGSDGMFMPTSNMTREQALLVAVRGVK